MKRFLMIAALALVSCAQAESPRVQEARELTTQLQQQLGAVLKASMKAEGPVSAIQVCQIQAPSIAGALSGQATVG